MLATIREEQRQVVELAGLPEGWLRALALLVLIGLCYVVVRFYRHEARVGAGPMLRRSLAVVRCAVLVVLAIIWLEPVVATYTYQTLRGHVAVLVDDSASMSIRDPAEATATGPAAGSAEATRAELVADLLSRQEQRWLRRLAERNVVSLYTFGERTDRVELDLEDGASAAAPQTRPAGPPAVLDAAQGATDLGRALIDVLDDLGGSPLAGVVILTDGGVNRGMTTEEAAALLERFRIPAYAVGVGESEEPPNVRVTDLAAPATIAVGDPLEIRVQVAAAGVDPTQVELTLSVERVSEGGSSESVLATRSVPLGGDAASADLLFTVPVDQPGEFIYRARVDPQPAEASTTDNERQVAVLALDERLRVLIVAGRPSYDYRPLMRLLELDKTIDVSTWLQSADTQAVRDGDTVITSLPRKQEELLEYDAVLLLDPDPRELDSPWAISVRRLVDEFGGGLLLQAGPLYTTRFLSDARLDELIRILPIVPDPDADVRLGVQGAFRPTAFAPILPDDTSAHPLVQFSEDATSNREIWSALPGVWWHLPVLREKPLASVLLRHSSPALANEYGQAVLFATQPVGAGRTVFLGFDSTWRWRATAEPHFNRFWIQMIRYLAQARRQGASKRGTIVLDRESFRVGDFVKAEVRVLDESFTPWHEPSIRAALVYRDQPAIELVFDAIPQREGWFAGRFSLDRAGPAVLRVPLPGGEAAEAGPETLVRHMLVQRPDRELVSLRLRSGDLELLARRSGGRFLPLASAEQLPELIEDATIEQPPVRGAARSLWDRPWVLGVLAALLTVEWTLRRRNHLL